jgi:hypothetical protein
MESATECLTIKQIISAALPFVIPHYKTRTRDLLLQFLDQCPREVQDRIDAAAIAHSSSVLNKKRKLQSWWNQRHRDKHRKQENNSNLDHNLDRFLDLPSPEEQKDCRRAFLDATSNQALAQAVCASCLRLLFQNDLTWVDYLELKHKRVFEPTTQHESHVLSHGMLLNHAHVNDSGNTLTGWICRHCSSAQSLGKRPAYSLANDMWTGDLPSVLSQLTLPERLLIALRFPRAYVIKLYPKGGCGSDHPMAIQTKLKGNITTYHANPDAVEKMLEGQLMPRRTSILPSLIAVTFIGRSTVARARLKSLFRIRRRIVQEALYVLKTTTKHPGYVNLEISNEVLNALPEDEVPEEIYAAVRWDNNESVVGQESAGYVPTEQDTGVIVLDRINT